MKPLYLKLKKRHTWQWLYASVTLMVLLLGWKYPALGYVVVAAMLGGLISGPLAGRWFCGNLCPRGGFLERVVSKISPDRPAPAWLVSSKVRAGVILFLFTMVFVNGSRNPSSWEHWGVVFWLICLVTTVAGLVLAAIWNPRTWCAICPMGTMQNLAGGKLYTLVLDPAKCKECHLCEKRCPMKFKIIEPPFKDRAPQVLEFRDCIKCGECILSCPAKALTFSERKT